MKSSYRLFSLTALALSACASQKPATTVQAEGTPAAAPSRAPASMIWENESTNQMDESTAKWYGEEVAKARRASASANVQIAGRMAQAKLRGGTCWGDFYFGDVIHAYLNAVEGDAKVKFDSATTKVLGQTLTYRIVEKIRRTTDSVYTRNLLWALEDDGKLALTNDELDGVYFESPARGAYGSMHNITLHKDNTFSGSRMIIDESPAGYSRVTYTGKWQIKIYEQVARGRGRPKLDPSDAPKWESRGIVMYLTFQTDKGQNSTNAYRLRFENGEFSLQSRRQDMDNDGYKSPSFVSSVTGECDA